jgi:hypothetical protein
VLLEGDRLRVVWEGGSAPTAVTGLKGSAVLVGTEDGAVNIAAR